MSILPLSLSSFLKRLLHSWSLTAWIIFTVLSCFIGEAILREFPIKNTVELGLTILIFISIIGTYYFWVNEIVRSVCKEDTPYTLLAFMVRCVAVIIVLFLVLVLVRVGYSYEVYPYQNS